MFYYYFFYKFIQVVYFLLNSAVVAAILSVLLAGYLAKTEYRRQKKMERDGKIKNDIVKEIFFLQEKVHYVSLLIDRIAHTHEISLNDQEGFVKSVTEYEIPKLSSEINENIPAIRLKIIGKINIYLKNNNRIETQLNIVLTKLKEWHDPIVKIKRDLKIRLTKEEYEFLLDFDNELKKLIEIIWKENIVI